MLDELGSCNAPRRAERLIHDSSTAIMTTDFYLTDLMAPGTGSTTQPPGFGDCAFSLRSVHHRVFEADPQIAAPPGRTPTCTEPTCEAHECEWKLAKSRPPQPARSRQVGQVQEVSMH